MSCSTPEIVLYLCGGFLVGMGVAVLWVVTLVRAIGPVGKRADRR